jgi:hypothetical protein
VGYGRSPLVDYAGQGLYFLEAIFEDGIFAYRWNLKVLPHARFTGTIEANSAGQEVVENSGVALDVDRAVAMTLHLPSIDSQHWEVLRIEGGKSVPVSVGGSAFTFQVTAGEYVIQIR